MSLRGRTERDPSVWIDPRQDEVRVDGTLVSERTERVVVAFHKPSGLVTTRVDPGGRPTIYDRLGDLGRWLFPVGRLDRDTSGLLVLTNDHELGHRLTDPAHHVAKTYHARVRGRPDSEALAALRDGGALDSDLTTRPAAVRVLGGARDGSTWLELILTEGQNRQVRRMGAAVGHEVLELVRVAIGGLALGHLARGTWRELSVHEVEALEAAPLNASRAGRAPRR